LREKSKEYDHWTRRTGTAACDKTSTDTNTGTSPKSRYQNKPLFY